MMNKKIVRRLISIFCLAFLVISMSGCALNSYSIEELKLLYPKAFENSSNEELYYWKETVNTSDHTSWRTCNVYAEIDKNYEVIRDQDGEFANMKIDVLEQYNQQNRYKAICGRSQSSSGDNPKNYLFENDYDDSGKATNLRKTEITPQEYIKTDAFKNKYSLDAMLREFKYLTVDDMIFEIDNELMEHKGKTVKFSFEITDDYLQKYEREFGKSSVFKDATYATMEFAYDRFASIVIYANEKLGGNISVDKEIYKLETVYFGPIVNIPSYDSDIWATIQAQ